MVKMTFFFFFKENSLIVEKSNIHMGKLQRRCIPIYIYAILRIFLPSEGGAKRGNVFCIFLFFLFILRFQTDRFVTWVSSFTFSVVLRILLCLLLRLL